MKTPGKILFLLNVDWFFMSHRLPLALGALKQGYEVHVACGMTDRKSELEQLGLIVHPLDLARSGVSVFGELKTLFQIAGVIRRVRPDVMHTVTIKPVLYGNVLGRLLSVPRRVASISGLGYVFIAKGWRASLLRTLVGFLYRRALRGADAIIFQNTADRDSLAAIRAVESRQEQFIRGSGVALPNYPVNTEPSGPPVAALVARLLIDKGVYEFIEAARQLKKTHPAIRMVLVGDVDAGNRKSIQADELDKWVSDGTVEYWGYSSDVANALAKVNMVVLPSYREGLPKVLIEAAACGRAVITTDVPGCRDAIEAGATGLLVPAQNAAALALAIGELADDPARRAAMGLAGRELAEEAFDIVDVVNRHLHIYAGESDS